MQMSSGRYSIMDYDVMDCIYCFEVETLKNNKYLEWERNRCNVNEGRFLSTILCQRPVEMWWHTRRNQISSFGETDGSISIGGGRQFSRLLAAEVCASAVVMLDTPCSEVVWRVLTTHSTRQFPLHFPSRTSPCAVTFQMESTVIFS